MAKHLFLLQRFMFLVWGVESRGHRAPRVLIDR
jgi:hypothetical protein